MQDMTARLAKLRDDADDCILISRLATSPQKRELFAKLAEHLAALARDVELAIEKASFDGAKRVPPGGC